ncbi:STAS domain-containing protein [Seleniivibrio woodruffii]|uniref:STAS domain-containing protein n=1 Tax=Seleniivibrio woodruffii TaxID=1078050 RepID=UPI0024094F91|nr:STAS domain-containing protein [Seleniivibrio woodruffii]
MNLHFSGEGAVPKLTVSGSLTVEYASELLENLKNINANGTDLHLEIGEVDSVDMTFFQLMCSAHRTFTDGDRKFIVTGRKNELLERGAKTGFRRHKGCSKDKFGTCAMVMEN